MWDEIWTPKAFLQSQVPAGLCICFMLERAGSTRPWGSRSRIIKAAGMQANRETQDIVSNTLYCKNPHLFYANPRAIIDLWHPVRKFCSRRWEPEHKKSTGPQKTAPDQLNKNKNIPGLMINLPKRKGGEVSLPAMSCLLDLICETKYNCSRLSSKELKWNEPAHSRKKSGEEERWRGTNLSDLAKQRLKWGASGISRGIRQVNDYIRTQCRETKDKYNVTGWKIKPQRTSNLSSGTKTRNWSLGGWVFYIDRWVRGWTQPGCVCWQPRKPTLSSTKVGSQRIKSHLPVLQTELSDCLKIFPLPYPLYIYSNKPIIHFKLP